ncbi:type IV pilus assembly protein PilO [Anaerovirgula multivorans]|uniref:Type IV pilus assembly protein PilO n=1 Tax=Anaerovirgula multivorans TaxID=312168 RepID=A0A238ZV40_9FIRM|nr:hypothetical protein [Anaerovirgula multivorans]SNR86533.1 type IV pilus assembly protein PilO [Anaerovirgula multivorans]
MLLSKREKILVVLLAGMILLAGYYKFIMIPLNKNLSQLELDYKEKQLKYIQMKQELQSEVQLNNQIDALNNEILGLAKDFFGKIHQEDIILLLNDLILNSNIRISSLDFTPPRMESLVNGEENLQENDSEEFIAEILSTQFHFEGDYGALIDFLRNIREYEKEIVINNISISNSKDGLLSGNLLLDFYSIPEVNKYFPEETSILHYGESIESDEDGIINPFILYGDFIEIEENNWSMDYDFNDNFRKMTTLYGFEDEKVFFVGNPRDVYGTLSRDANAVEGRYAIRMEYDFIRGGDRSVANLVFEGDRILIPRQPEVFGLWIYGFERSDHKIGAIVVDARGREYKLSLADRIDWLGWSLLETSLPVNITYPAMVQRIYVESESYSDKTKGHFLFDKMEVAYPTILPYSNEINSIMEE